MRKLLFYSLVLFVFGSCRHNIMFRIDDDASYMKDYVATAEKNYVVQANDYLELLVYSNDGELLIDPNFQLRKEMGQQTQRKAEKPKYLVDVNGELTLPMLGKVNLEGLTLYQSDSLLSVLYSEYYESPFVQTKLLNKRVIVLGTTGSSTGQVIPLENDNMNLLEVLALAGGLGNNSKAHNIRLIRGSLQEPEVYLINLKTIEGMQQANLQVQPNDIVYVEPVRKVVTEAAKDIAPIAALFTSTLTLLLFLFQD